jgi:hypothetical protein
MRRLAPLAILGAAGAAAALVALAVFSYAFRRGESFAEGSSYRATPEGLRALALLAEAQGHAVSRLAHPWDLAGRRGALVVAGLRHTAAGSPSG